MIIDIACGCSASTQIYRVTDSDGCVELCKLCGECAGHASEGWAVAGHRVEVVTVFACTSEDGSCVEVTAATAREAAELYAADEYSADDRTVFANVLVAPAADPAAGSWHKVQIDPEEPDCDDVDHAWQDGPVRSSGGGIAYTDTCAHCGCRRHVDTWGTDPFDGTQGYRIVRYLPAVSE